MSGNQDSIRVLAIIESRFITGPAKNLLQFAQRTRTAEGSSQKLDFTIATYTRSEGPPRSDALFAAAESAGISASLIRERRKFDHSALVQITRLFDEVKPDVIQTHNSKSHFFVRLLRLHRRVPWIAFHHGYTKTDLKMELIHRLDRWSLRGAHRVVTVCAPFREELVSIGVKPDRISVHHNAVAPFFRPTEDEVIAVRRQYSIPTDRPVLVAIGRLSKEKGHIDLLRAMQLLSLPVRPHLVLVGEGVEHSNLEYAASSFGIARNVTFVGHQGDIRPFLAMSDAFVLPSHSEGSPNALLEAMAAGLPIIATSVGGVPEIATHRGDALLVEPRNIAQLASALSELFLTPTLAAQLGDAALRTSLDYTYDSHQRRLTEVYVEASARQR